MLIVTVKEVLTVVDLQIQSHNGLTLASLSAFDFLILCLIVFPEMALRRGSLLSLSVLRLPAVFQN